MDFRTRLEQGRLAESETHPEADESPTSEYFATDRVKAYPVCLDLRLSPEARVALPYTHITEMHYNGETGIQILTSRKQISIHGRNLTQLFNCLINYRVRYVQANIGNDEPEDGLFVKEILIEDLLLL